MPLTIGLPLLSALVAQTEAHGSMTNPVIRGIQRPVWPATFTDNYAYEPQTLGATGGGAHIPICGRLDAGIANRRSIDPVTEIVPGQPFTFTAHITAHHMGHMTLRLCPLIDASWGHADLAQCVTLKAAGETSNQAQFWWLGVKGTENGTFPEFTAGIPKADALPASASGGYTIQWRYNTANSCNPQKQLYPCRPDWTDCHGECLVGQAKECVDGDIQLYGNDGKCDDDLCCSEVFTNCADVVFEGVPFDAKLMNAPAEVSVGDASPPPHSGSASSGSTGGGGTSSSSRCVAKGAWAGIGPNDDWCATNVQCGGDGGATCDCSCSGDTASEPEPEPEPGHVVTVASEYFEGWNTAGLQQFCNANMAKYCAEETLVLPFSQMCSCTPTPAPPTPAAPTPAAPTPAAPMPEPEIEPASTGSATATEVAGGCPAGSPPDSCNMNECKLTCQTLCIGRSGGVSTNQGWGDPRFIHCKCSDNTEHKFVGCECRNSGCPESMKVDLAQMKLEKQATKVSRHLVQEHRILDVDARGRLQPIDLDA